MAALPAGASGTGLFTVPLLQPLTPYDRFGDAPLLLLTLAAAVLRWRWRG
jgi:apolipoprotein N-acyltransferase